MYVCTCFLPYLLRFEIRQNNPSYPPFYSLYFTLHTRNPNILNLKIDCPFDVDRAFFSPSLLQTDWIPSFPVRLIKSGEEIQHHFSFMWTYSSIIFSLTTTCLLTTLSRHQESSVFKTCLKKLCLSFKLM